MDETSFLEGVDGETEARLRSAIPRPLPPGLVSSVERHKQRLADLVDSMRRAGLPESVICSSVRTVSSSFGDELIAAARSLTE